MRAFELNWRCWVLHFAVTFNYKTVVKTCTTRPSSLFIICFAGLNFAQTRRGGNKHCTTALSSRCLWFVHLIYSCSQFQFKHLCCRATETLEYHHFLFDKTKHMQCKLGVGTASCKPPESLCHDEKRLCHVYSANVAFWTISFWGKFDFLKCIFLFISSFISWYASQFSLGLLISRGIKTDELCCSLKFSFYLD